VIDLAILGLLDEGDLHGYEIRRRVRAQIGLIANISYGSLYPALAKLEKAGDVVAVEGGVDRSPGTPPSTGSLAGERAASRTRRFAAATSRRSRKVYRITEQGRAHFAELLAAPGGSEDAKAFGLRWSFARHLEPAARLSLLERRRAQLLSQMDEAEPSGDLDRYARSVVDHAADSVARDIRWLDELITVERAALDDTPRPTSTESAEEQSEARRASA
jgi:DNA-binding PadR family transcriptional regulator